MFPPSVEIIHEVGRNQSQPSALIQHVGFHREHPKEHAFSLFDNLYDELGAIGRVGQSKVCKTRSSSSSACT
jgi:hypothetical protein